MAMMAHLCHAIPVEMRRCPGCRSFVMRKTGLLQKKFWVLHSANKKKKRKKKRIFSKALSRNREKERNGWWVVQWSQRQILLSAFAACSPSPEPSILRLLHVLVAIAPLFTLRLVRFRLHPWTQTALLMIQTQMS